MDGVSVNSQAQLDGLVGGNANASAGGSAFLMAAGNITPGMFSIGQG